MHRYFWHKNSEIMPNLNLLRRLYAQQQIPLKIYIKVHYGVIAQTDYITPQPHQLTAGDYKAYQLRIWPSHWL